MDLDAAGGAASAGIIVAAIEKPAGHAGEHHGVCADCGAQTSGKFCSNCGQPTHLHRSLLHLGEEILHGVMHFDGRIWRTLPLLFLNPGRLTREWVHGKRSRYVSPLGMYLFTVFVMFMALSFMPVAQELDTATTKAAAAAAAQPVNSGTRLFRANNELVQAETALEGAPKDSSAASTARRAELQARLKAAQAEMNAVDAEMEANPTAPNVAVLGANWAEDIRARAVSGDLKANTGDKKLDEKLNHKLRNPEFALYKIQQTFYKFSFLLIPISIPFVAVLFLWKRGFTLYDHGVFVLYSLTFMALLIMAAGAVLRFAGDGALGLAAAAVALIVPVHMFAQLKGAYSLGFFSTTWRTVLLLTFCWITLMLFVLTVTWLGLTG